MNKALFLLQHIASFYDKYKEDVEGCGQAEWTIDCDDYKRIKEAIEEFEKAMKPKSCKTCHHYVSQLNICLRRIEVFNNNYTNFCCNRYEPKEMR